MCLNFPNIDCEFNWDFKWIHLIINYALFFLSIVILSNLQNVGSAMMRKFTIEKNHLLKINFVKIIFLYLLIERMFNWVFSWVVWIVFLDDLL